MVLTKKIGQLDSLPYTNSVIEYVHLEWFECRNKILHKKTDTGRQVVLKMLKEGDALSIGDVVYQDEALTIAIDILPAQAIVFRPSNSKEMAAICYEIGNRHMPLFYDDGELAVPYEAPLHKLLLAAGYKFEVVFKKLNVQMKTSVLPHQHGGSASLFSKIMQLTSLNE